MNDTSKDWEININSSGYSVQDSVYGGFSFGFSNAITEYMERKNTMMDRTPYITGLNVIKAETIDAFYDRMIKMQPDQKAFWNEQRAEAKKQIEGREIPLYLDVEGTTYRY